MKIIVTGGHLTPAVSFMRKAMAMGDEILFVGRKYASKTSRTPSMEMLEAKNLGVLFTTIESNKFHRHDKLKTVIESPLLLVGLAKSLALINSFKPDLIMSFGGHLALPIALTAKSLGVLVVTHEQTRTVGLSNQIIGKLANKVAISWRESEKFFPKEKIVITGNPIRGEFFDPKLVKPDWAKKLPNDPMIYIMGGNQGSVSINDAIRNLLPGLTRNYVVVHQCGSSSGDREFTLSNRVRQTLSKESRGRYIVRSWFSAPEVAFAMRNSRMVISRSGANAVFEIMASKVPSILIPLWFAYKGEQSKNAEFLVKGGSALMIKQTDLSRGSLMSAISAIENNYSDIKNKARSLGRTVNSKADLKLYELVRKVYEEKTK